MTKPRPVESNPSGPHAHILSRGNQDRNNKPSNEPLSPTQIRKLKVYGGSLASLLFFGTVFKDGLTKGFSRISNITNGLSNLIAVPFSFLFPIATLDNERNALLGKQHKDDLLNRMTYTAASLGFTPNTWGEPLKMGTRSKAHMIATILNLPHMLFTLFSYTGGRLKGFLTYVDKYKLSKNTSTKARIQENMLDEQFEALYKLGNLGSAQASVVPMAGQCILGWETISDIFKGDFSSAVDRFKKEPISVILGTLFNSWMWPFEYVAKIFDTTVRTAEGADQFRHAFKEGSLTIKMLDGVKHWWHKSSQNQNTLTGKLLKWGREASKIEALILPPIGMISIVVPTFNRFLRGEFWNKEAQEIGGTIGIIDKIFNVAACFSHIYYTGTYALNIRLPQTIATSTFYIANIINRLKGIDTNNPELADENYRKAVGFKDPAIWREKIFSWKPIKALSDKGADWLDSIELQMHSNNPKFIKDRWVIDIDKKERRFVDPNSVKAKEAKAENRLTKFSGKDANCRHIRSFAKTMAEEVCYATAKDHFYKEEIQKEYTYEYINDDGQIVKEFKPKDAKPSPIRWVERLKELQASGELMRKAEEAMRHYLKEIQLLDDERIEMFMNREYFKNSKDQNESSIEREVEELLMGEIKASTTANHKPLEDFESNTWTDLITKPQVLLESLKLRFFHAVNSILPLWINGFVKVVDYGKNDDPFWLRNLKATESGIREGDVQQACNREYMPVTAFAFQSMGKGLALLYNIGNLIFRGQPLPSFSDD